ncbi:MAG: hypothetical protein M5U09_19645 [Gammaproteobacteria bacterium]|nr:hypothetical protein [Gammaproteobacteria bacterium]
MLHKLLQQRLVDVAEPGGVHGVPFRAAFLDPFGLTAPVHRRL